VEQEGIFCALYSDRASHFFWTPRAGGKVDPERLTQVGLCRNWESLACLLPASLDRFVAWTGVLRGVAIGNRETCHVAGTGGVRRAFAEHFRQAFENFGAGIA
jgi:hypothetical protein